VPGSLDKKAEEDATFFCNKRRHLLPLLLSNEPGTGISYCKKNLLRFILA
jgi:hypothetical protein